jgi:tRNA threonylcarbamoyladenosine biosynthesis protein TsaB
MLLAIDTSTAQVGLALAEGENLVVEKIWHSKVHHTAELAPAVSDLFERGGVGPGDIQAVGVATGPGSFTALRVGISLAKGLAVARAIPLVGIPTLDILAAGQPASDLPLAAILQAGRNRVAVGWYRLQRLDSGRAGVSAGTEGRWESLGSPEVTTIPALAKSIVKPSIVAGELGSEDRHRLARKRTNVILAPPNRCVRRPSVLAELARARYSAGSLDDAASLSPLYLQRQEPAPA